MTKPACFDREDDYREWMAYSKASRAPVAYGVCWDCNPVFQAEMIFLNRCEYPDVDFHYSNEGPYCVLQGYRKTSNYPRIREKVDMKRYLKDGDWYVKKRKARR